MTYEFNYELQSNPEKITVYKIVDERMDGQLISLTFHSNPYAVEYKIGEQVVAPIGFLFAYSSLFTAKENVFGNAILLIGTTTRYILPPTRTVPNLILHSEIPGFTEGKEFMNKYWNSVYPNDKMVSGVWDLPRGTILIPDFTPERMMRVNNGV